jgi:hypothetical protein
MTAFKEKTLSTYMPHKPYSTTDGYGYRESSNDLRRGDMVSRGFLYLPFLGFVAAYSLIVYGIAVVNGLEDLLRFGLYSPLASLFLIVLLVCCVSLITYLTIRTGLEKEPRPVKRVYLEFGRIVGLKGAAEVIVSIVAISIFNACFTSFKAMIGVLNPFHLDPLLARIDQAFHGGIPPWEITHSIVTSLGGTFVVDTLYASWVLVLWGFLIWNVLRLRNPVARQQFLLAYVLSWGVMGSLLAYVLSSAGPCYYGPVTGLEDIYAPLMERLHKMDEGLAAYGKWYAIKALDGQEWLWSHYTAAKVKAGAGISAMPSMHVSFAVLFALSAWQVSRVFGIIMAAYAFFVLFGSVLLGWHYAIDGYLAIPLSMGVWWFSGCVASRFSRHGSVS